MAQGKTYNKSPRRINHKAPKSKTNTGTTASSLVNENNDYSLIWGHIRRGYNNRSKDTK